MKKILIQPTIDTLPSYEEYAQESGCNFEVIDFAFPENLDTKYESLTSRFKTEAHFLEKIVAVHGPFIDLYINSTDSEIKRVSEARISQSIEAAENLGAKYVIFHTNILPMIEKEVYYQNWVKLHVNFWKEIVQNHKITVLLENMWDKSPECLAEVIERVDSTRLKALFDTGHAKVFSKVPVKTWFEKLRKNIEYIHLNDNKGDVDSELPAGQGTVDWKEFDTLVKTYCNEPLVCVEVKDLDWAKESIEYLKKNNIYPFS